MHKRKIVVMVIAASFVFSLPYALSATKDFKADLKWLHHNGTGWISFGPGIIASCRRIDLFVDKPDAEKENRYAVVPTDKGFDATRDWVKNFLEYKFDFSMNTPEYKSARTGTRLVLYTSESGLAGDVLTMIPLSPKMLDEDEKAYKADLEQLKKWMSEANNQLPFLK
ncbi:MAG TPA: hypothetical protein V6C81_14645 [Planktothrix sp.]|jgi:hypothetical protein